MPSFLLYFFPVAQLPLTEAGQLLLVAGGAFAVITLIASTYRFHRMIQLSEAELATVEDCNDFFFIQVTRYLSKITRTSSGFGIFVVQFISASPEQRRVQEELLNTLKGLVRKADDKVCLFREDCVAAILDTEESRIPAVAQRITADLKKAIPAIPSITAFRAGVSSFPMHGSNTQIIIDTATNALETVSFDSPMPFCLAPSPDAGEDGKNTPEALGALSREDKNAAIDLLTGVLKPGVVASYMRKYLSEIRRKKEQAALLCIGINRIDQIIHLHGETAADDVIAGVSGVLQRLTRDCDLLGRFHRDDFMVLAPCSLQQGEMIATRLREAVQKEVFTSPGKRIKTAVSIGITAHPEHGRNLYDLFRGSYRALEVVRSWNTTACLVYDPAQHGKKAEHESRR
jgi:diguanylate cyclase (GGDEF)-like protein